MRVDKLWLSSFKNLQDFEINFDEDELISVVVGRNGTGKSNIIEALVIIFRDLDLGKDPLFAYKLWYKIGDFEIFIDADPIRYRNDKRRTKDFYRIQVTDSTNDKTEALSISRFSGDEARRFLPRYVFGYYSGPSNRLEQHFEEHQDRFYRTLINQKSDENVPPLRPLLYARLIHSQFALLAFFLERDTNVIRFLEDQLHIVGLDSVLFILKTPKWANSKKQRDDLFWTARGTVRVFMERLHARALAPFRLPVSQKEDYLYMYIKDDETLQDLAQEYFSQEYFTGEETSYQSFFKALESTYISDLIKEVRIKVRIKNVDGSLTFRELSEGEQQLLMVLGLMRFTKEEESLFLLDEPDTHLNPAWSVHYLDFIQGRRNIVGLRQNSQVLITTHNPMTLAGLKASQVKIVHRTDDGRIYSAAAEQDPRGMGFAGILTSDIFGLRSTLDNETLAKLDRQRRLLIKEENELTEAEKIELNHLNQELEDIDATRFVRDPYYALFVKGMKQYEIANDVFQSKALTAEELAERDKIALSILEDIFSEVDSE
jgi:predicted ATPase